MHKRVANLFECTSIYDDSCSKITSGNIQRGGPEHVTEVIRTLSPVEFTPGEPSILAMLSRQQRVQH
jgi:hypothetical protein